MRLKPRGDVQAKISAYLEADEDRKIRYLLNKAQRDSELTRQQEEAKLDVATNKGE